MKKDNTLPLLIGAGALALMMSKKSQPRVNLSGDDARDALSLLKEMGAPPDLLAYLATKPTMLKEAMSNGTINGKPLPTAPKAPPKSGGAGGGGAGGGIGSMSGKGGTDVVGAALALAKLALDGIKKVGGWLFGPSAPTTLQNATTNLSENDYNAQLMAQVQAGNITQDQADLLRTLATETGDTSARSIGDVIYEQASALRDEGSITEEQFLAIMEGSQTANGAQYENAWAAIDAQTVEAGGTPFTHDVDTPPDADAPYDPNIDYTGGDYGEFDPSIDYTGGTAYDPGIDWPALGDEAGWPDNAPGDVPIDIGVDIGEGDYSGWEDALADAGFDPGAFDDFGSIDFGSTDYGDYDFGFTDGDYGTDYGDYGTDYGIDYGDYGDYGGFDYDTDYGGFDWDGFDWGGLEGMSGLKAPAKGQPRRKPKQLGVLPVVAGMTALEILAAGASIYTLLKKEKK